MGFWRLEGWEAARQAVSVSLLTEKCCEDLWIYKFCRQHALGQQCGGRTPARRCTQNQFFKSVQPLQHYLFGRKHDFHIRKTNEKSNEIEIQHFRLSECPRWLPGCCCWIATIYDVVYRRMGCLEDFLF